MKKNKIIWLTAASAAVIIFILAAAMSKDKSAADFTDSPTFKVRKGHLTINVIESGTIKAKEQTIIKNELEGRTSIVSIVPEGTRTKPGELLVELDASALTDSKINQEIMVQNTEAAYINAKENLAITENQAKSDVDLANLNLDFAKQDLDKYIKGEFPYELQKADAQIAIAEEEAARTEEKFKNSEELFKEQYISQIELTADQLAAKKAALDAELAKKSKELLAEYTYKRQLAKLQSDLSQAQMAKERTERKANANIIQAQADMRAKESEYNRQQDRLKKINEQLEKTKIYAPTEGLVIYATSVRQNRWGSTEPLEVGTSLSERQEIIYLPKGDLCKAEVSIHESNIKKIALGMPAAISVDALLPKTFTGVIDTIAPLPNAQSAWLNPDLKVYNTEILIDGNQPALKTGMSCQAEIIVEQLEDVLYVPLQAVVRIDGKPVVYVQNGKKFEPKNVETGLDNNKMIHIKSGLEKGDIVLLNPPLKPKKQ